MNLAVIIPCLNEEVTIAKVVRDLKQHLPEARIYVFDNGSTDKTASEAEGAGATVIPFSQRGKGRILRHAFNTLNADYYLTIDGDDTYPAHEAPKMLSTLIEGGHDMVVGSRLVSSNKSAFPALHYLGNKSFRYLVMSLFGKEVDVTSGLRMFSRRFFEDMTLTSSGFEIEAELTVRGLMMNKSIKEVSTDYSPRPPNSQSKLRTFQDGFKILGTILKLYTRGKRRP